MNAAATSPGPFTWSSGSSTTNYALYAMICDSTVYTPNAQDVYLGAVGSLNTAMPTAGEPAVGTCALTRQPVFLESVAQASKTNPQTDYTVYTVDETRPPNWTSIVPNPMNGGWVIFYWDMNIKNKATTGLTAGAGYHPSTITGGTDYSTTSPLIGWAPLIDSTSTPSNIIKSWAGGTTVTVQFDTSFSLSHPVLFTDEV